jgi:hypothetical protein
LRCLSGAEILKSMARRRSKILGRKELEKKLNQIAPRSLDAVAEENLAQFEGLAQKIKGYAPSKTGRYKRSINARRLTAADNASSGRFATKDVKAVGLFAGSLWRLIEFGTKSRTQKKTGRNVGAMPRKPHIFPVYRSQIKRIKRAVNKAMRQEIKKVVK